MSDSFFVELDRAAKIAQGETATIDEGGNVTCVCGADSQELHPAMRQGGQWALCKNSILQPGLEPLWWCDECGRIVNSDSGAVVDSVAKVLAIR